MIFSYVVAGNALFQWILALAVAVAVFVALMVSRKWALRTFRRRAERDGRFSQVDKAIWRLAEKTHSVFIFVAAIVFGAMLLRLPPSLHLVLTKMGVLALFLQMALWGTELISLFIAVELKRRLSEDPATVTSVNALALMAQVVLWSAVVLMALQNLGVNVTTLVAGLGISSIAVALGLQSVLGDLFASIAIALDKPFVIGDFIIVGNYLGTVEYIGIKSTRIRSLSGEIIVFANSDLLKDRIQNYRHMVERRVLFSIGLVYGTPLEKLERVPKILKAIVESIDGVRFDRAHFKAFGASSLDFEIVYYVQSRDYTTYMDAQQAINLKIVQEFAKEGISMAFPTQTIYLESAEDSSES